MITAPAITAFPALRCSSKLRHSVLGLGLGAADLARLEALGEIVTPPSGTVVFRAGEPADHLCVVLDGVMVPESAGLPRFWVGPGDVCGETGFVLGAARSCTMIALGPAPRLFRVRRDVLALHGAAGGAAVTRLLSALGRAIRARLDPSASDLAEQTEAAYCDHEHPQVAALARSLRGATTLDTACAIWSHVWSMPYRFGSWQWSASDTLRRGHGMCTTKAVLQVALMRAVGIEAGYVRGTLDGTLVRACMAPAYHARFERGTFKHFYAAARIDGRWAPLDASYSRGSLALIAETAHHVKPFVTWNAREHGYANGGATLGGTDPYDIEVHQDLTEVMRKSATYDAKNADAMNVLLDQAQGYAPPPAAYTVCAEQALAAGEWARAREIALDGVTGEALRLQPAATYAA